MAADYLRNMVAYTAWAERCYNGDVMAIRKPTRPKAARTPRKRPAPPSRDAIDLLVEIGRSVPRSEWKKFPRDAAKNFDHYAHGSPREA